MIPWLEDDDPLPPVERALGPDSGASGLLAASAAMSPARLLSAYRAGIFPWYSDDEPVLWWSPDPRMVLLPGEFRVSHSLRKTLKQVLRDPAWEIRIDADFTAVMQACAAAERPGQDGTWITASIVASYTELHRQGFAHSVESWYRGARVGGLYGVSIGGMFFGESMFARRPDASKIALAALVAALRRQQVKMIDCQQNTAHLASLGGRQISRAAFVSHVRQALDAAPICWRFDKSSLLDVVENPRGCLRDPP